MEGSWSDRLSAVMKLELFQAFGVKVTIGTLVTSSGMAAISAISRSVRSSSAPLTWLVADKAATAGTSPRSRRLRT